MKDYVYFNCDFNINIQNHINNRSFRSAILCLCQVIMDVTYTGRSVDSLGVCADTSLISSYVQLDLDTSETFSVPDFIGISSPSVMYDVDVDITVAGLSNYRTFVCISISDQDDIQDVQCHATCTPPNAYIVTLHGI